MIEKSNDSSIIRYTNVHETSKPIKKCEFCNIEYVANRSDQKFCSNSCKLKNHRAKQMSKPKKQELVEPTKTSIDKMSIEGAGNAFIGAGAVEVVKSLFTSEENKAATKGDLEFLKNNIASKLDLQKIENKIGRYHRILNMRPKGDGTLPYYDMIIQKFIHF